MPKIFRMTKGGKVALDIFEGATINTPSMLCVEDYLDALKWGSSVGGLNGLVQRSNANLKALAEWVEKTAWVEFLAESADIRSNTSVCIKVVDRRVTSLSVDAQADFAKKLASLLEKEGVALDAGGYRDAPPGLRIWCGATVDASDVDALTPWMDWAFETLASELREGRLIRRGAQAAPPPFPRLKSRPHDDRGPPAQKDKPHGSPRTHRR